jgi:aspartate kinase
VAGRVGKGLQPVVVVSAMAKVTDLLLSAAATAARGDRASALAITQRLRIRHHDTATQLALGPQMREDPLAATQWDPELAGTQKWMDAEFDGLEEILRGLAVVGELTPRISDMIVSYGERISSRMITEAFSRCGLKAVHVDARQCIVTDAQYGKAIPLDGPIEQRLKQHVAHCLPRGGFR